MLTFSEELTVSVLMEPVDMRCSIDGLVARIITELKEEPQSKTIFLFCNKGRDKVKGVFWDKNGFMLLYKRMDKGRFRFPKQFDKTLLTLTHAQCYGLLSGFDFIRMVDYPELDFGYFY